MQRARVAIRSGLLRVSFLLRGVRLRAPRLDGRVPAFYGGGKVTVGRGLALRSRTARIEIGALAGGVLDIGDDVFINQGASVVAAHSITIGSGVRIADFAAIYDSDFHPVEEGASTQVGPVVLGANAWIGRGALILRGVTVGAHAVVASGSVVTGDVEARTLVAGNPARVVRTLTASDGWHRP